MTNRLLAITSVIVLAGHGFFGSAAFAQSVKVEQIADLSNGKVKAFEKLVLFSDAAFRVTYVVVTPNLRIGLALPQGTSSAGSSLGLIFQTQQAVVGLNGGFLRTYAPATPAGLMQVRGEEINGLSEADAVMSGVVCFGGRRPAAIVPLAVVKDVRGSFPDCIQGGPLLVSGGRPSPGLEGFDEKYPELKRFVSRRAERSFVLRTARNETVLGVTEPVSLIALRAFMLASEKEGGFGAVSAIALTGGSTAGLIIGGGKEPVRRGGTVALLPNAIVVQD